ncbi:MAG: hypothetical protein COX32_01190 [Candidatus Moranbacteria bacterium CG23_combo_of_CG06-09_8_20_14_all_41_28]|nr:MAG: hypothetical protein COX32_01190 [Candidatus Moranbacteria bacterium CG23_combo_of_CG06-09_8_20_14_all_41_28]
MKTTTTTKIEFPAGYMLLEDKIAMVQHLHNMRVEAKKENLDAYGGPDYDKLQRALVDSCVKEVQGLDAILYQEGLEQGA